MTDLDEISEPIDRSIRSIADRSRAKFILIHNILPLNFFLQRQTRPGVYPRTVSRVTVPLVVVVMSNRVPPARSREPLEVPPLADGRLCGSA